MYWDLIHFLHVVAMAFFLGGQIMLAGVVVPVLTKDGDVTRVREVARRFGLGTMIAFGVLILTGMMMASHISSNGGNIWTLDAFEIKMTLVVLTIVALMLHMKWGRSHALMGLTFLLTLATVYVGVNLYTL